jgi:hypothetical protein
LFCIAGTCFYFPVGGRCFSKEDGADVGRFKNTTAKEEVWMDICEPNETGMSLFLAAGMFLDDIS